MEDNKVFVILFLCVTLVIIVLGTSCNAIDITALHNGYCQQTQVGTSILAWTKCK